MNWPLQDAKNKLSQVIEKTLNEGPQVITRHGREVVVMLAAKDFKQMKSQKCDLVDFFQKSPLVGELKVKRNKDRLIRNVNL